MDAAPRLAALSCVVATACLLAVLALFLLHRAEAGRRFGHTGLLGGTQTLIAFSMTGALNLLGLFYNGYVQLHAFNWIWVLGSPVFVAAIVGRSSWGRIWGGPLLFVPGWLTTLLLMLVFGIDD